MQQRPREDRRRPDSRIWTDLLDFRPTDADVDALIARASADSLGADFLLRGELGSVATWLRTHAFTVVAARERLLGPRHRSGR
jgi:hypothetical protein